MNAVVKVFSDSVIHGRNDNTYKFALARFLLDYISQDNFEEKIPYSTIADKFLEYYWNQIVIYRLKQDFKTKKIPRIFRILEEYAETTNEFYESYFKKPENTKKKKEIIAKITKECLADVIPRFQFEEVIYSHNARSKPRVGGGVRYYYPIKGEEFILLNRKAAQSLKENHNILLEVVILEWAKFLEKTNFTPKLIQKIKRINNPQRGSLTRFKKILLEKTDICFYCGDELSTDIHVDHVIPWSFIFSDDEWNLVLSCQKCNLKKSNSLPAKKYIDKLKEEHSEHAVDLDKYYKACKEAGFQLKQVI